MAKYTVYKIVHVRTGKVYVGSTRQLKSRLIAHKSKLRRGIHPSRKFQKIYSSEKSLVGVFQTIRVSEGISERKAVALEQYLIDKHAADGTLLNESKRVWAGADERLIEARAAKMRSTLAASGKRKDMSKAAKRVWRRNEYRDKMSKIRSRDGKKVGIKVKDAWKSGRYSRLVTISDDTIVSVFTAHGRQVDIAKQYGISQAMTSKIRRVDGRFADVLKSKGLI